LSCKTVKPNRTKHDRDDPWKEDIQIFINIVNPLKEVGSREP
jgi:hypothetical protein